MIPLRCLRQPPLGLGRSRGLFAPAVRRLSPRAISAELSTPLLARRVSSKPPTPSSPTPVSKEGPAQAQAPAKAPEQAPPAKAKPFYAPRLIIYHYGLPRVFFLGIMKLTSVFIFGFFIVVTIPTYAQADAPTWQIAGLVVASTIPFLAIWYLTSPMVMWIHMSIPSAFQRNAQQMRQFVQNVPPTTEVALTTMSALGKPRVTKVPIQVLRRERRRFGLVNYVRDVKKENAKRKWYQFRAVGEFRIEEDRPLKTKEGRPWIWYSISKTVRDQQPKRVPQSQPRAKGKR